MKKTIVLLSLLLLSSMIASATVDRIHTDRIEDCTDFDGLKICTPGKYFKQEVTTGSGKEILNRKVNQKLLVYDGDELIAKYRWFGTTTDNGKSKMDKISCWTLEEKGPSDYEFTYYFWMEKSKDGEIQFIKGDVC